MNPSRIRKQISGIYWKGSESHNIFVSRIQTEIPKFFALEVSPFSSKVVEQNHEIVHEVRHIEHKHVTPTNRKNM
tara:strand:- start:307 stop:531 length:225 start_codon:yes stop_codon:yes gene_type:complete